MRQRVTILGAGPAGLWTALSLYEKLPDTDVTVIEKEDYPGGITASFRYDGLIFDYGSHRLHPATDAELLDRIQNLLKGDLQKRPRNGRIWMEGRFISFPLKFADLLFHLPPTFSSGVLLDSVLQPFRPRKEGVSFEETLLRGLGKTISSRFYFPYAEKLWGLPPGQLSPVQARKRIASGSIWKMFRKVFASLKGKSSGTGFFYYPREGFGQIAAATAAAVEKRGGRILYGNRVVSVLPPTSAGAGLVKTDTGMERETDFLFSTIPITELLEKMNIAVPYGVLSAARGLSYRSMVFLFMKLDVPMFTQYDAHYFPGLDICFSRFSEQKNYSMAVEPNNSTGLCFEIPCTEGDKVWNASAEDVYELVMSDLKKTDLPVPDVQSYTLKKKRNVYPVYNQSFSERFSLLDHYLSGFSHMVSLGRQGLFVHDNTHHTMQMGAAAADCLTHESGWNRAKWEEHRKRFERHVVVD